IFGVVSSPLAANFSAALFAVAWFASTSSEARAPMAERPDASAKRSTTLKTHATVPRGHGRAATSSRAISEEGELSNANSSFIGHLDPGAKACRRQASDSHLL